MNSNKPFLVLCERRMVSIKRKLNNKPVGIKSKALKDLEKGMTNKDVAAKQDVSKNLHGRKISTKLQLPWKRKEKAHAVGATTKQVKQFSTGLLEKEAKKFQLMGSCLKKKPQNLRRHWELRNLKHRTVGSVSGRKGINITTAFYLPSFVLH